MSDITIIIYHGNTTNGELQLSRAYCQVDLYDRIHWVIDSNANVASIEMVHKKPHQPIIFIGGPSREGNGWTGKVMFSRQKDSIIYNYYIKWKVKGDSSTVYKYDPKIAVKPHAHFNIFLLSVFIMFGLGLATLGVRRLFFKK